MESGVVRPGVVSLTMDEQFGLAHLDVVTVGNGEILSKHQFAEFGGVGLIEHTRQRGEVASGIDLRGNGRHGGALVGERYGHF